MFGLGHRKEKKLGPVARRVCPNCHNEDFWELREISTWFTLFFIPLFPYGREHLLVCPICRLSAAVPADEVEPLTRQAQANLEQLRGTPQ
ncbi:MAG: zinc-ribbon domain-containing protein [Armatimonadetes bacterium]|nr:zinc-ribbon domain-containing protein [Armatimonadota bacterium]